MSFLVSKLTNLSATDVYLVVAALVFGETGLFIGFVLPGETAVIVGGFIASLGHVNIAVLCVVVVVAAVLGGSCGYLIGWRGGERLLRLRLLQRHQRALNRALDGLRRRGATYVFVGRFAAFLRTVLPSLAGMSEMSFGRFTAANITSAMCWGTGYGLLGYFAGSAYKRAESYSTYAGIAFGVLVVSAVVWSWLRSRRRRAALDATAGAAPTSAAPPPDGSSGS